MVSPNYTLYINTNLKVKAAHPDLKKKNTYTHKKNPHTKKTPRLKEAKFTCLHATNNTAIGLGFKVMNQRPALLVPRAVSTCSQLVPPRIGIPQWKEKLHNEAGFNGNLLFSRTPSRIVLLSRIIFSNYLFLRGGGGNIDDKMAPSYSILLLPVCLTHTCWQEWASASSFPAELEVDFNLPLPSPSSWRLSA